MINEIVCIFNLGAGFKTLDIFLKIGKILYCKEERTEEEMQITRISPKHQITIPREVFERLRLEVGDFLEVNVTEEGSFLFQRD